MGLRAQGVRRAHSSHRARSGSRSRGAAAERVRCLRASSLVPTAMHVGMDRGGPASLRRDSRGAAAGRRTHGPFRAGHPSGAHRPRALCPGAGGRGVGALDPTGAAAPHGAHQRARQRCAYGGSRGAGPSLAGGPCRQRRGRGDRRRCARPAVGPDVRSGHGRGLEALRTGRRAGGAAVVREGRCNATGGPGASHRGGTGSRAWRMGAGDPLPAHVVAHGATGYRRHDPPGGNPAHRGLVGHAVRHRGVAGPVAHPGRRHGHPTGHHGDHGPRRPASAHGGAPRDHRGAARPPRHRTAHLCACLDHVTCACVLGRLTGLDVRFRSRGGPHRRAMALGS